MGIVVVSVSGCFRVPFARFEMGGRGTRRT